MPNLFNAFDAEYIEKRIDELREDSKPLWGKMNAAQMLKHCNLAFGIPLEKVKLKRSLPIRIIASLVKNNYLNPFKNFKKNLPTAPNFVVKEAADFNVEKIFLKNNINNFINKKEMLDNVEHGFIGKINHQEWGIAMYKHLDHHLRQFGV